MSKSQISQADLSEIRNLGTRIRETRKFMGLTQADFAALGGVSLGAQNRYEAGGTDPGAAYFGKLAEAGIDIMMLITGRRCSDLLDSESAELVSIFAGMPPDMRDGLLTFARSMGGYVTKHGLGMPAESATLHSGRLPFAGEKE